MKPNKFLSLLIILINVSLSSALYAQVTIESDKEPDGSALLELNNATIPGGLSTKGLLLPRVAITDTLVFGLASNTMTEGMTVYSTSLKNVSNSGPGVYYWNSTRWIFTGNSIPLNVWKYGGNTILPITAPQSVGTINAADFNIITNNETRIHVAQDGIVSLTNLPASATPDVLMATSASGELRKTALTRASIARKYIYTTAPTVNGQEANITLTENPLNSTITVTSGTTCDPNSISVSFACSSNSTLYLLNGWAVNAPYTYTLPNPGAYNTILDMGATPKDPANTANPYTCTDGSGGDFGNFRIAKVGATITITNNATTASSPARVYTITQVAY